MIDAKLAVSGAVALATGEFDSNIDAGPWREFCEDRWASEYRNYYYLMMYDVISVCEKEDNIEAIQEEVTRIARRTASNFSNEMIRAGKTYFKRGTGISDEEFEEHFSENPLYEELVEYWNIHA